jgi:hypothetical protein
MPGAGGLSAVGDIMGGSGSGFVSDLSSMFTPSSGSPQDASTLTPADMGAAGGGMPGFMPPGMPGAPGDANAPGRQGDVNITNNHDITVPEGSAKDAIAAHTAALHRGIRSDIGLARNTTGG